jgi:hypothetical protein
MISPPSLSTSPIFAMFYEHSPGSCCSEIQDLAWSIGFLRFNSDRIRFNQAGKRNASCGGADGPGKALPSPELCKCAVQRGRTLVATRCDDHESKCTSSNSLGNNLTASQLQSTVVVPAVSTGAGYHAIWPGLENDSGGFVYQNVISDSNGAGSWQFWIEYCCEYDVPILSTCSSTNPILVRISTPLLSLVSSSFVPTWRG